MQLDHINDLHKRACDISINYKEVYVSLAAFLIEKETSIYSSIKNVDIFEACPKVLILYYLHNLDVHDFVLSFRLQSM